jgi:hypothetical protein
MMAPAATAPFLLHGRPTLRTRADGTHLWELRGPWNIGQPVHETMTAATIDAALSCDESQGYEDPAIWEYVRGAIWNDDPEGMLFDDRAWKVFGKPTTTKFSSGVMFAAVFKRGEKAGRAFGPSERSLLKRSHFGDLQFLHAMGVGGEQAEDTLAKILRWAEFTYEVATGEIEGDTEVVHVPISGIPELFRSLPPLTIAELFLITSGVETLPHIDVGKRAAGSLMHMVQDSFAAGHVARTGATGDITEFHAYEHQDHAKHKAADQLSASSRETPFRQRILRDAAAGAAVTAGESMLRHIAEKAPWPDARATVEGIFSLAPTTTAAGPGVDFAAS